MKENVVVDSTETGQQHILDEIGHEHNIQQERNNICKKFKWVFKTPLVVDGSWMCNNNNQFSF